MNGHGKQSICLSESVVLVALHGGYRIQFFRFEKKLRVIKDEA